MKPSEILDNAANILLRDGWHQGMYYEEVNYTGGTAEDYQAASKAANQTAPCCQAGAITRAAFGYAWVGFPKPNELATLHDRRERDAAVAKANGYMRDLVFSLGEGEEYTSTVAWNDAPGRTKDEVVAALRAAAERARAAGE